MVIIKRDILLFGQIKILHQSKIQKNDANYLPCITNNQCNRCQSTHLEEEPCLLCSKLCLTCQNCRQFGRSCACCVIKKNQNKQLFFTEHQKICVWEGELTEQQKKGSNAMLSAVTNNYNLLVCAVTGAGKTEMLFPSIELAIRLNKKVCICAPRVDVILELFPRISTAFATVGCSLLYGKQKIIFKDSPIVICTVHQLNRFHEAFDVIIVDEVDSFPLKGNQQLMQKINMAKTKEGTLIYLTATPNRYLFSLVKLKKFHLFQLSARYHRFKLPVPKLIWIGHWEKCVNRNCLPQKLIQIIKQYCTLNKRFLLFCPKIDLMLKIEKILKKIFNQTYHFTSVSSLDDNREQKVAEFRKGMYDFLLTTTILERGVTFSNIHVIVLGIEHRIFTVENLVQIAGRVGRNRHFPTGDVLFLHYGIPYKSVKAIRWIKTQNDIAKKMGFLE